MATAYILAVRNRNGCEVLLAQKNVIDFRRTLPADNMALHVFNHPGEYVLPGGEIRAGELPAQAALRRFCELLRLNAPRVARLRKCYEAEGGAHFWLLSADDNPWLSVSDEQEVQRLNNYYKERDAAVFVDPDTQRLVSSWPADNYGELHALHWAPPAKAAELLSPRGWLSKWQEEQYELVRRALPAYSDYDLFQIHSNRRMPPHTAEGVLRHLVQNPLVTIVQVYKDYQRLSPMLTEGVGQVVNSPGEVRLQGHGLRFTEEPLLGNSYFVVASDGPEVILLRTMLYTGRDEGGAHLFVSRSAADPDESADSPYNPSAEE